METREQKIQGISYSDIIQLITSLPIFNEIHYDLGAKDDQKIMAIIEELPKWDNKIIHLLPLLESLKPQYQMLIESVRLSRCTLTTFYTQFYEKWWNDQNIKQLKEMIQTAVAEEKITLFDYHVFDQFITKLTDTKEKMQNAIQKIKSKEYIEKLSAIENEILQEESLQIYLDECGLAKRLKNSIETMLEKELKGWAEYDEVSHMYQDLLKSHASQDEISACHKVKLHKESCLSKDTKLHGVALAYAKINKHDFESLVAFVNQNQEQFPLSFKEKFNFETMKTYIQRFSHINLQEMFAMNEMKLGPSGTKLNYEYKKMIKEYRESQRDWNYFSSLVDESPLKDFYRLVALGSELGSACSGFFKLWRDHLSGLLDKAATPESKSAIVYAALECFSHRQEGFIRSYLDGFVKKSEEKFQNLDAERIEILKDLTQKEEKYHAEMPSDAHFTSYGNWQGFDAEKAKMIFQRLSAVQYMRIRIHSGESLTALAVKNELTAHFGKDIARRRGFGFGDSHVDKVLKKMNLKALNHRFFEIKEEAAVGKESNLEFKKNSFN